MGKAPTRVAIVDDDASVRKALARLLSASSFDITYSNNHDVIASKDTGFMRGLALHAVDALGLVHALILRLQALILPFKILVFSGH